MKIPYTVNSSGWTFFVGGRPVSITPDDPRYNEVIRAVTSDDDEELTSLLTDDRLNYVINRTTSLVRSESFGDLEFVSEEDEYGNVSSHVTYKLMTLPEVVTNKLIALWNDNCKNFDHYFMFIENLMANPSERAREELYTFLSAKELPITQDGTFIAYKAIDHEMISYSGNVDTRVLKGERLSDGRIRNNIGDTIKVVTADVDDDCTKYCSCGLHVGSYRYANDFVRSNGNIVAVEVNPAHVVSVPTDCNCEKCRVSQYKVLNIVEREYTDSPDVIVHDDNTVEEVEREVADSQMSNVEFFTDPENVANTRNAIDRNIDHHSVEVDDCCSVQGTTIRQLVGSVGRKRNVSYGAMLAILLRLGYNVRINNDAIGASIVTRNY